MEFDAKYVSCTDIMYAETRALLASSNKQHAYRLPTLLKNIPNIFYCNFEKDYQLFIIFGRSISETTGQQMTIHFPTSPNVCFCTTWGDIRTNEIFFFIQCSMIT